MTGDHGNAGLGAVLFDMDGTLIDSEKIWQAAIDDLAASHGATLSVTAKRSLIGKNTPETMAIIYAAIGQPWRDHEAGGRWLEDHTLELFRRGVAWRPGARELLLEVRSAGIPTALVTATARIITETVLDTIGRDNFDVVITDDDVSRGKPDPEPYASAAAALAVPPSRCVAIEDSPNGSASALAAGCVVVAVPSEVDLSQLAGVTLVPGLNAIDLAFLDRLMPQRAGGCDLHRPAGPRTTTRN